MDPNTDNDNKGGKSNRSYKWLWWLLVFDIIVLGGTYIGWANVYDFVKQAIITMGAVALLFGPH
jgi:hypothetical protein